MNPRNLQPFLFFQTSGKMKADIGKVASKMWFDFMLTSTRKYYFIYYGQFHVIFVETITCRDFFFLSSGINLFSYKD